MNAETCGDENSDPIFENPMTMSYKQEETAFRKIINDNVKLLEQVKTSQLQIYYKNKKLKHVYYINRVEKREDYSVEYPYKCGKVSCVETKTFYISRTSTTTTKKRMKQHTEFKFHRDTIRR